MKRFSWDPTAVHTVSPLLTVETNDPDRWERAYATAVWSCLVEPGDAVAGILVGALGAVDALQEVLAGARAGLAADASGIAGGELRAGIKRWQLRLDAEQIAFSLETARARGIHLLTPDDSAWPRALDDLGTHAPLCLWVRGDVGALGTLEVAHGPAIALVGARAATGYGEHLAAEFAADLAGRGVPVVSGAAYGIDGAAHRGALAAGGPTVALLAGGVDRPYPAGHADLLRRIADQGAVASEVPCGSAPTRWRFLQRNRLIAALGTATVVVEAGWRSGSLNTAAHAAELGRPLGAVPGPVTSGSSAGCHRLLREFDARCITTADDIAEMLGLSGPASGSDAREAAGYTGARTRVSDALSTRVWRDVADIARRCGMAPDEVSMQLGLMALDGAVEVQGPRWRRRAPAGAARREVAVPAGGMLEG
nr:DNA-processing protein DprA [Microbacterium bovistercoris]